MKKSIESANFLRYNANSSGNASPDCVKRGISYAFDKSYIAVAKELNELANSMGLPGEWNTPAIYSKIIKKYGGSDRQRIYNFDPDMSEATTVDEFADKYNTGTYLLEVGKNREGSRSSHLVAIVDGEVIDSWDSRKWFVKKLYTVSHQHAAKTDIWSEDNVRTLTAAINDACSDNWHKITAKLAQKNSWSFSIPRVSSSRSSYKITCLISSRLTWAEGCSNQTNVEAKFVFTPTMTMDEAFEYIKKNAYTRVYDRLWTISKQIKDISEQYRIQQEIKEDVGLDAINRGVDLAFMDEREKRFFNSLPGSIRGRVKRLMIQNPGQFSDSYQVKLYPIDPNKTNSYNGKYVDFEAYNAADMKDMLKRYVEKGEVPYEDYEPSEEY